MPEYIEDVKQLVSLISSAESTSELSSIREMARNAYMIKLDIEEDIFGKPVEVCLKTSDEGIDLSVYWAPIQVYDDGDIENFRMSQMNLYLCTNCARNYKNIRDVNKKDFKKNMKDALKGIDSREDADTYDVILNYNMTLHFTQTHLMEIQTLFQLIDEYGLPQSDEYDILGGDVED